MKANTILLPSLLLVALAACQTDKSREELGGRSSMWVGDALRNASLNKAIVVQHTLYPYHFESGSSALNDLGQRDLAVLIEHFRQNSGQINVNRGGAAQPLYEARLARVQEALAQAEITSGEIVIKDGPPGGEGMSSERVILIQAGKMSGGTGLTGASMTTRP